MYAQPQKATLNQDVSVELIYTEAVPLQTEPCTSVQICDGSCVTPNQKYPYLPYMDTVSDMTLPKTN